MMTSTTKRFDTYEQWRANALARDAATGMQRWVEQESSSLFDYNVIRARLEELADIRESGDANALLFYMNEGFHGNMSGMGSPRLYQKTALGGTKRLITNYIDEMVGALDQLQHVPNSDIDLIEKYRFFRRAADCFGRSALMLSGAGSLGPFHVGVVKALSEHGLVPNVMSGASAGSVVTALVGTQKQADLARAEAWTLLMENFTDVQPVPSRRTMRQDDVRGMLEAMIPDWTFEEAFEETGMQINISVAPTKLNQRARLLNVVQSPNAYIREAVLASCAVPGVFQPVTLMAKTQSGERKPYIGSRKWMDGSVTHDLPARRLARLYGVNHFIASQANPAVLWALQDPNATDLPTQLASVWQSALRDWSKAVYPFAMNVVRDVYPANMLTRMWFSLLSQEYTADINISLGQRLFDPTRLLSPLTEREAASLVSEGENATWPKVEMIRNCTAVSRKIDEALRDIGREVSATYGHDVAQHTTSLSN